MSAFALPVMGADGPIKEVPRTTLLDTTNIQQDGEGNTYLDVYYYEGYDTIKYTWNGDLVIGDTAESSGHVDNVGAFVDNWEWVTPEYEPPVYGGVDEWGMTITTKPAVRVVTAELKVAGNVTVQGNGKVVLGGNFNDTRYLGIEAKGIAVNGGNLTATKIIADDLVVNGGTVLTHTTGCNEGSYRGGLLHSSIKNSLTISGGSLSFGYAGDDITGIDSNRGLMTVFGDSSFTMTQTGGTMNVYGAMSLIAGASITQKDNAGVTVLRDTVFMQGSGTTEFNQSADKAILVIGRLESTGKNNVQNIEFSQSGEGLIHLAYGSNFKKESTISLNQTGNGTINIGGGHDTALTGTLPTDYALDKVDSDAGATIFESVNTTYNVDQSGSGTINVNGALSANEVRVGGESKLNLNEDVTVNSFTQSGKGKVTVAEGKTLTTGGMTIEGGVFENHGTISGTATQAMLADADFFLITISGGEYANHGVMEGSIFMDGGTFTMENGAVAGGLTAISGTIYLNGDVTFTDKVILGTESTVSTFALLKAANSESDALTLYISQGSSINADELTVGSGANIAVVLNEGVEYTEGMELFTVTGTDADQVAAVQSELGSNLSVYEYGNTEGSAAYTGTAIGSIITTVVPEPATATLSLLALAALAARRRRK